MPIRSRRPDGSGRVGTNSEEFCIHGIDLATRQDPVHNEIMESFLTGSLNPFNPEPLYYVDVYTPNFSRSRKCFYTSIWNLAAMSIELGRDPRAACQALRQIGRGRYDGFSITHLTELFLPRTSEPDSPSHSERLKSNSSSAVSQRVLETLAEEGIMESDAEEAIPALVNSGVLRSSSFREGGVLFMYGDDRRHIVSRILNYISARREDDRVRAVMAERRQNNEPRTNTFDPTIDMLTGRTLGCSSMS